MKKAILIVGLVAIGILIGVAVAGFFKFNFSDGDIILPESKKPVATTTPSVNMTLEMKKWTWVLAESVTGQLVTPKTDVFTLTFEDGRVSVGTDCNSMGGSYQAKDGALTFSDMMSTLMYCEGSQESQYALLLGEVKSYSFNDKGGLVLTLKDGGTMLFR